MKIRRDWEKALKERFADRPMLDVVQFASLFNPPIDVESIEKLRAIVASEFALELGLLRPDDKLDALLAHPTSGGNPFRWLFYEGWSREASNELDHQLTKRLEARAIPRPWPKILTVDDLVTAWAGQPSTSP
jgi:hypothetical protein